MKQKSEDRKSILCVVHLWSTLVSHNFVLKQSESLHLRMVLWEGCSLLKVRSLPQRRCTHMGWTLQGCTEKIRKEECWAVQLLHWSCDAHWTKIFQENNWKRSSYKTMNMFLLFLLHKSSQINSELGLFYFVPFMCAGSREWLRCSELNLLTTNLVVDFSQLQRL